MSVFLIGREELLPFLAAVMSKRELIAPIKRGAVSSFEKISVPADLKSLYLVGQTNYSPKRFFFEPRLLIYEYKKDSEMGNISVPKHSTKQRVIFGLRACDSNALLVCDDVLIRDGEDIYYKANRFRTLVIGFSCASPCKNGFCDAVGHGNFRQFDLLFSQKGDDFVVHTGSPRGEQFIGDFKKFFISPKGGADADESKIPAKNFCCGSKSLDKVNLNRARLKESSSKCFSCHGCSAICPTCTCFDIQDIPDHKGHGRKYRIWDSCLDPSFSTISGVCFRSAREERVEHFELHKLKFHKNRFGRHMCVGCGRCIWVCLAGIDITKNAQPDRG